jgi:hypothetical protein
MKIMYALIAACLSLQACNSEAPTASTRANENSVASEYNAAVPLRDAQYTAVRSAPAITSFDDYSFDNSATVHLTDDEYVGTTGAISAIKPIDGAEFDGTSRDDTDAPWSTVYYLVDFDPTATVTPKIEQIAPGFQGAEDAGLAFENVAPAIEATPWP